MASGTFSVTAGVDDGYSKHDGSSFGNSGNSGFFGDIASVSWRAFFRVDNVTVPTESTITSAILRIRCSTTTSSTTVNVLVHCEAADDPATPSDGTDLIGRSLTTGTAWSAVESMTGGSYYDSPDILDEVQEVIDRGGWSSGQALIIHVLDNGSSSSAYRLIGQYNFSGYEADLVLEWDELSGLAEVDENLSASDTTDAEYPLVGEISESFSSQDSTDALNTSAWASESLTADDVTDAFSEAVAGVAEALTADDATEGYLVVLAATPDEEMSVDDTCDAFNYSEWKRDFLFKSKARFLLTLTGDDTDIEIPVSAIYARKRSGDPTYLQATIPSFNYAAEIALRPSGEMLVDMAYEVDGEISLRERILEADLEEINTHEGPVNRSVVLTGHRTTSYGNQITTFATSDVIYRGYQTRARSFRFAFIDPFLNPGDTVVVGDESFTCNNIVYIINPLRTSMEVREAL
jgi:hypothetical protein